MNMPRKPTTNAASASNRASNTNTTNGVPEHRTAPTTQTHMTVTFGWGSRYLIPLEAALELQRIMSRSIRLDCACNLVGNHDLWVRSASNIDMVVSFLSVDDEYAVDRTTADIDIIEYATAYKTTKELGGSDAVAGLTFAKYLAEKGETA